MTTVIGITGHMGAGKDAVAGVLVSDYGYQRVGFADAVKALALACDPLVAPGITLRAAVDDLGWDEAKRAMPTVRHLLQRLGHGAREVIGQQVWIDALAAQVIRLGAPVVIADVRYPNEARDIRRWGGAVWMVERPGHDGDSHPSERGVDEITPDLIITNDGTLDDLRATVRRYLMTVVA